MFNQGDLVVSNSGNVYTFVADDPELDFHYLLTIDGRYVHHSGKLRIPEQPKLTDSGFFKEQVVCYKNDCKWLYQVVTPEKDVDGNIIVQNTKYGDYAIMHVDTLTEA